MTNIERSRTITSICYFLYAWFQGLWEKFC